MVPREGWSVRYERIFDQVFTMETAIAAGVFVAVVAVLTFAVVHARARPGRRASKLADQHFLEGTYALVLLGFAIFLAVFTASANARETKKPSARPKVQVAVTAFQWCWRFHYLTQPVNVTATCNHGDYPTMVVPVGQPVKITLTSTDVIHSFWVPALKWKLDVFPHHTNTFTITITKKGEWIGRCAEFCGDQHATMHFHLRAVSASDFAAWSHHQQPTSA